MNGIYCICPCYALLNSIKNFEYTEANVSNGSVYMLYILVDLHTKVKIIACVFAFLY